MRTPGSDFELAAGFLFGESIITHRDDVLDIAYCTDEAEEQTYNVVSVTLRPGLRPDLERLNRNFFTTSSCGVCGKASLEALEVAGCEAIGGGFTVPSTVICEMPGELRAAQRVFESTGGLHAAGLFTSDGTLVTLCEDVGRHNALDKLIGWALLQGQLPLHEWMVLVSGRSSFELAQKCLAAGVPILCSVSAPSSLAVSLAEQFGLTLVGFLRGDRFNVYAGEQRLSFPDERVAPLARGRESVS
jgi:FdhD protein